jgi:hypothetical protein
MDDKATAAKIDPNTATAQECADWLAGDDGWTKVFADGYVANDGLDAYYWKRDGRVQWAHPYSVLTPELKPPWRLERIEVASDGKNTVTIYNGYTANRISIDGPDRLTAEYRAAVAARLAGMEGRG